MAFIKRVITDRNVVGGQRYTMTTLGDGRVEIVPSPDSVIEAGTQVNADLLQRYEDFLEELQGHVDNVSNPHGVTKAQVGLASVKNVDTTNATNITGGTLNKDRLPSDIPQANIVGLVTALTTAANHIAATNNPHGVTKAQVGLSNVKDFDTTNATNITSGTLPVGRVPTGIPQANISGLVALSNDYYDHKWDWSNPHQVTKAQVGLGNVTDDAQLKASDKTTVINTTPNNNRIPSEQAVKTYVDGNLTGAISTVLTSNLLANRALISNASGKIASSNITNVELAALLYISSDRTIEERFEAPVITQLGFRTSNGTLSLSGSLNNYRKIRVVVSRPTGDPAMTTSNYSEIEWSVETYPSTFWYSPSNPPFQNFVGSRGVGIPVEGTNISVKVYAANSSNTSVTISNLISGDSVTIYGINY